MYFTPNKRDIHIHMLVIDEKYRGLEMARNEEGVVIPKRRKLEILNERPKHYYVWIKN